MILLSFFMSIFPIFEFTISVTLIFKSLIFILIVKRSFMSNIAMIFALTLNVKASSKFSDPRSQLKLIRTLVEVSIPFGVMESSGRGSLESLISNLQSLFFPNSLERPGKNEFR